MTALELRDLTLGDALSLGAFRCTGQTAKAGVADIERQITSRKVLRAVDHVPGGRALGAVLDGRVVGCTFIEPIDTAPLPEMIVGARFVRFLAVHDDVQGVDIDGIGRLSTRLLEYVHDQVSAEVGHPAAVLLRVEPANTRAAAFYTKHHYIEVATESGPPFFIRQLD